MKKQVTLGLPQFAALPEPTANLARAETMIRQAASQGAQIVCLYELCSTLYFCQIEDPAHFDLTEAMPGPTTDRFGQLAKELGIVIVLPLFENEQPASIITRLLLSTLTARSSASIVRCISPRIPGSMRSFISRQATSATKHGRRHSERSACLSVGISGILKPRA